MRLLTAHKIFISIAIVFFALLGWRQWQLASPDNPTAAAAAAVFALLAVALAVYLRWVFRHPPGAPRIP